jgi:prepilin-type N-terminal cleavage/methylation domain-containing protein
MTLPELLVAMAISAVIVSAAFALFKVHHAMALKQDETTLMQQELGAAMTQMTEELRMCGYSPKGLVPAGFEHRPGNGVPDYGRVTNRSGVYCTQDSQQDGKIDENGAGSAGDHVGYRLNVRDNGSPMIPPDNILRKYDTGAVKWQPLCTNIGALEFIYRDSADRVIPSPDQDIDLIRTVEVRVTAVPSTRRAHLGTGNRTMSSTIWCRNLSARPFLSPRPEDARMP